jgi:hypothetical protein
METHPRHCQAPLSSANLFNENHLPVRLLLPPFTHSSLNTLSTLLTTGHIYVQVLAVSLSAVLTIVIFPRNPTLVLHFFLLPAGQHSLN